MKILLKLFLPVILVFPVLIFADDNSSPAESIAALKEAPAPEPPIRFTVGRSPYTLTKEIQSALDQAGLKPLDLGTQGYLCVRMAIDAGAASWVGGSLANGVKELCCGSYSSSCAAFIPGAADSYGIRTLCDNSKAHIDIGDYIQCVRFGSHECKTGGEISAANCQKIKSTCSSKVQRDQAHCVWEEALNALPPFPT